MKNEERISALRNYGYRYLGKTGMAYTFGKPIGYGILRADIYEDNQIVEVMLLVKGEPKNGKKPNLIWSSKRRGIISLPGEDLYLAFIQAIADCEAEIFLNSSVAIPSNRGVRYDFEENQTLCVE